MKVGSSKNFQKPTFTENVRIKEFNIDKVKMDSKSYTY